jgi:hypothetical protein
MEISVKNYKNTLPKGIIQKAEKLRIRECDEIEKGHFQAYVDEGETSFDVTIVVNGKGEVTSHLCDCKSRSAFCLHKTALLSFVAKDKKVKGGIKGNKSISQIETLLGDADPERLKAWIKDLLSRNQDLSLAFIHHFSEKPVQYSVADIKRFTADAVKAVVKNKRKLEVGEVKKIVDLWTELHDPFVTQYLANVADEGLFLGFNALMEACEETQFRINATSNKILKYLESLLLKAMESIHNLQNENTWDTSAGYFADRIPGNTFNIRMNYLNFLSRLADASSMQRRKRLTIRLVEQYVKCNPREFYHGEGYTFTILNMVKNSGLFAEYYHVFKPVSYKNEYNRELIGLLVENGHLTIAEKFCLEQIKGNSREEFNVLYLKFLKEIYTIQQDDQKLVTVLMQLFPETFDFADYVFINARIASEEEKKNWRSKILTRSRRMAAYNDSAMLFSFQLLDHEEKYKKMLEFIKERTPYHLIIQYAEKMISADRKSFLKELLHKSDDFYSWQDKKADQEGDSLFVELLAILQKHYSKSEIQWAIKNVEMASRYSRPNRFVQYVKENPG